MIVRIVKMSFKPENVDEFISIFNESKEKIRNSTGCSHLELLNDKNEPSVFFTYSLWDSENDLNNYRNSELFASVWKATKLLFQHKPEAWSLKKHTAL